MMSGQISAEIGHWYRPISNESLFEVVGPPRSIFGVIFSSWCQAGNILGVFFVLERIGARITESNTNLEPFPGLETFLILRKTDKFVGSVWLRG